MPSYFHVNVSRARYSQLGAKAESQGSRFRRPITPFIPAPRNLPRLPWLVPACKFLIANLRLECFSSPTKQGLGAMSNRERIVFPMPDFCSRLSLITHPSPLITRFSNRNNRIIRNSPKCSRINTYAFPNGHKSTYSGISCVSLPSAFQVQEFSPQQTVRQPSKSVRIRKEMAVSPQALRTQSVAGQNFVDSVNPATGEVVARIPATPTRAQFRQSSKQPAPRKKNGPRGRLRERCAMLRKLRDAIFERRDEIAEHRHARNRQAARRSHPRRSASRAGHRRISSRAKRRGGCVPNASRITTSR